jgi:hypothetical protein
VGDNKQPDITVLKAVDPMREGRCISCLNPRRKVNYIRIRQQVVRLCGECSNFLTRLLK